jgi:hypothetical protein
LKYFTMLWPYSFWKECQKAGEVGKPLRFLWGGHNLQSRFSHFKVEVGDTVIPITVREGRIYVIAAIEVERLMNRDEYLLEHPEDNSLITHGCADEVLVGKNGKPIQFNVTVPSSWLCEWRYESNRGERGLKGIKDGRLENSMSLHGIYRLTSSTAKQLMPLLT